MKTLDDYRQRRAHLLKSYDLILASTLLPIEKVGKIEVAERRDALLKETFTVAVCGQMNAGKSTLLNALIFGGPVLPMDATAMTAKNTAIQGGNEEAFEALYYSEREWGDVVASFSQDPQHKADFDNEVRIAAERGATRTEYVFPQGRVERVKSLARLNEFVTPVEEDKEGKFTPFVKELVLFHPHRWLKDVTVVDTPGVNDPVGFRSDVTKNWIRNADAVVYVCYAGRAMTTYDVDFIDRYLLHVPSGKRLFVANKADVVGDVQELDSWLSRLGQSNDRMRSIMPEGGVVWVSARGALIAAMKKSEPSIDPDLLDWLRGREIWLTPENHGMERLRELIEAKLVSNVGEARIESHQRYVQWIFEEKLKRCRLAVEQDRSVLEFLEGEIGEIGAEKESINSQLSRTIDRLSRFRVDLTRRVDEKLSRLHEDFNRMRKSIITATNNQIESVGFSSGFKNEVWSLLQQFDEHQPQWRAAIGSAREAIEGELSLALMGLKEDLGRSEITMTGAEIGAIVDVSVYTPFLRAKEHLRDAVTVSVIEKLVSDNANFFQRLFNTKDGLKNIRSALKQDVNEKIDKTLGEQIGAMKLAFEEAIKKTREGIETAVNETLNRKRNLAESLAGDMARRADEKLQLVRAISEGEARIAEVERLRTEIGAPPQSS